MTNRQWIYAKPIEGKLATDNFKMRQTPVPTIRQGQTLVRNKVISLDPANRTYFKYQGYRPKLHVGEAMHGFGVGEVVETRDYRFKVGDIVHGDMEWADYSIINSYDRAEFFYKCTPGYSEEDLVGALGIPGLTALFGLEKLGPLRAGQTVVVAGATGACGTILGQLAKIAGCRVIGFGGGIEKCRWLVDELGFDDAVDYKGEDVAADLASKCPDGVDFFSDATGGIVTTATLPVMNKNAPWYHFGEITTYDDPANNRGILTGNGLTPELETLCDRQNLKPRFLLVFDYYCERIRAEKTLASYMKEGRLKAPKTVLEGLENLPSALVDGTFGSNRIGKLSVRIS
ncbi:MAG: NADP-dependent oxidoreductase [Sphingomonadales bacterium]|nr:NADP-dependent oxidoreductase [Sphingomonadales bacterium]